MLRDKIAEKIFGATYAGKGRWNNLHQNIKIGWYREADQIISLFTEELDEIVNPWKWNKDYEDMTCKGTYYGYAEAIQAMKDKCK